MLRRRRANPSAAGRAERDAGPPPVRAAIVGDDGTAPLAVAARLLGWHVVAVAGGRAAELAEATGAAVHGVDPLLGALVLEAAPDAPVDVPVDLAVDLAIVGTGAHRRLADVARLGERGVPVIVTPGHLGAPEPGWAPSAPLAVGDATISAPAVQVWFAELAAWGAGAVVEHASIRATLAPDEAAADALARSAHGIGLLSERLLGRGDADPIEVALAAGPLPSLELQAATGDRVVRAELLPTPTVEVDGRPIPIAGSGHPATAFGAVDLLRTVAADLAAGRRPVLGVGHLAAVAQRLGKT